MSDAFVLHTEGEHGSSVIFLDAGPELRLIGADGTVRQTLTTAEREAITAPPAIGSDGSVWVGTEKAIYVAR